ncbi:Lrp/AsnC family transcriptional regulator [Streptomyces sp. HU2014]|uniref:Lrp/AsnC family transcriptional regulator n=1 Tax=Streptomyces sp. HU2014 TaxID=2939414 RepID=UPI00200BF3C7|nr:Lrp/AsnC family transcriptional regulator [Streptomyces sp. HU2014]UQI43260.1 Lrp/AsnC family transcriptional regulator [Streptomyces sp. HU2014]
MDTSVADPAKVLDPLDRRIVSALQIDGRAETRRIAEVLGVSARTVARRLARMREAGLLRVTRMPDPKGTGAVGALVLRVRVLRGKVETLADALAARPDVPFVDILMGGEEIGAVVVPTAGDRDRLLYRQLPATRAVAESTVHAVLHVHADAAQWRAGWLDDGEVAALTPEDLGPPAGDAYAAGDGYVPDALDLRLLAVLDQDARLPGAALAAELGAPESTVRRRLRRLTGAGLLRTHVGVDPRLLGMAVDANLWLEVPPARLAEAGRVLAAHPRVHGVLATSGPANLLVALFCEDLGGLYRFTTEVLAPLGIARAETTVVGRAVKRAGVRL